MTNVVELSLFRGDSALMAEARRLAERLMLLAQFAGPLEIEYIAHRTMQTANNLVYLAREREGTDLPRRLAWDDAA
jgi:hypothetical protein